MRAMNTIAIQLQKVCNTVMRRATLALVVPLLIFTSCSEDQVDCEDVAPMGQQIYDIGSGDCYEIFTSCAEVIDFRVYDRWGAIVYNYNRLIDPDFCWMGTDDDGSLLEVEVYLYDLQVIDQDDHIEIVRGNVTLLQ